MVAYVAGWRSFRSDGLAVFRLREGERDVPLQPKLRWWQGIATGCMTG